MSSSTIRSAVDATVDESSRNARSVTLGKIVAAEWRQSGRADLVHALRRHPLLLRDKSQLLNLAIEEYRTNSRSALSADLERHCHRFREFGSSVERSIFRQLETQRYIDCHPELLELLSTPEWPKPGDQFGEFQVLEELGIGSAAHVYLCLQSDVGFRQVVVKATPFSSFEASILGRLNDQNIIPIHSTGSVDEYNLNFLCMPFCGRSTLTDLLDVAFLDGWPCQDTCISTAAMRWMRDGELPAEKPRRRRLAAFRYKSYVDGILEIAIQIADALQAAHERGILHGDLKPSNVLLTPDGRPLLLDFNLSQDYVRAPGVCGGTLPYMPPEYLRVLARHAEFKRDPDFSAAPDVYSFGALLYELLTGFTPVTVRDNAGDSSATAEHILAQLEHGVPKICQHNRFVSRRLESIVLQCLAFDPNNRASKMTEIRKDLQSELGALSVLRRTARLRPVFFASVAGLSMAVLAGAGTYIAVQPDRYVANYNQGLQLASANRFDEAADYFTSAARNNPSFVPARFQLARTRLAMGDIETAIEDFGQLARKDSDVHSMAYMGYCFNRNSAPAAAIVWYEKAIENGAVSAAIYNNLAASYIAALPHISKAEQLHRAEYYLNKALALDPTSTTIQLNLVRRANAVSKIDASYDAWVVWQIASTILKGSSENAAVRREIIAWYRSVVAHDIGSKNHTPISEQEKSARDIFAELVWNANLRSDEATGPQVAPSLIARKSFSSPLADSYYVEPVSISIAQQTADIGEIE